MPNLPGIIFLLINIASACFQKYSDLDDKIHSHSNCKTSKTVIHFTCAYIRT